MSDSSADPSSVTGSATVRVDAPPDEVFALLTDLDRLPSFSPENERCEILDGFAGIAVGTRFRGYNKAGDYEWHADCEVTELEPGRRFAYEVPPRYEHATTWRYTIEPSGDGCVVTESFHAPLLAHPEIYPGKVEGRRDHLERACVTTMTRLKAAAEDRS